MLPKETRAFAPLLPQGLWKKDVLCVKEATHYWQHCHPLDTRASGESLESQKTTETFPTRMCFAGWLVFGGGHSAVTEISTNIRKQISTDMPHGG